ncbi:MAG: rod shape-determining protein MreC [Chitinophagia bacterium]
MKNIIGFIRQNYTFFCFLILQIVSLVMLSSYSKSHQTYFSNWNNAVAGKVNSYYNEWAYFFDLKATNAKLVAENVALRNELAQNFVPYDTSVKSGTLILRKDSLEKIRKFFYYPAKVVGNSFTLQKNYITIERGALEGVKKDMAAISPDGSIVGVVVEVNDHYSKIMSLLHRNSKVSAMLKRDRIAGSIEWDGNSPEILSLKNISKSALPKIGDTVLTSPYSSSFPAQLMIGRVTSILKDPSSNFLTLNIKSATNFYNLEYVYLVQNKRMEAQTDVEQKGEGNE